MNIVWSSEALGKLDEIERFIAQDSSQRAAVFIDRLPEKGDSIALFPEIGRVVPASVSGSPPMPICRACVQLRHTTCSAFQLTLRQAAFGWPNTGGYGCRSAVVPCRTDA